MVALLHAAPPLLALFQLAWVIGALIPTVAIIPSAEGLAAAGVLALGAQTVYVAGLIRPRPEVVTAEDEAPAEES